MSTVGAALRTPEAALTVASSAPVDGPFDRRRSEVDRGHASKCNQLGEAHSGSGSTRLRSDATLIVGHSGQCVPLLRH